MAFFEDVYRTARELQVENPIIPLGDIWIEKDTGRAKRGNGAKAWNDLPYWDNSGAVEAASQAQATAESAASAAEAIADPDTHQLTSEVIDATGIAEVALARADVPAVVAAADGSKPVYLPGGTHSVSGQIAVPNSAIAVRGSNEFSTRLNWAGTTNGDTDMMVLDFTGSAISLTGWRAGNFWLSGADRDALVLTNDKREVRLEDVRITAAGRHGIRLGESWNMTFDRVYVYQAAEDGIHTEDRTGLSETGDSPGQAIVYLGCHLLNNGRDGLRVGDRCQILGCVFEDNLRAGVFIEGRFGVTLTGNYWEGANNAYNPAAPMYHLWIKDSQSIFVNGETIFTHVASAIRVENSHDVFFDQLGNHAANEWNNESGTADSGYATLGHLCIDVDADSYNVRFGKMSPAVYFIASDPAEGKVRFDEWFEIPPTANEVTTGRLDTDSNTDGLADGWTATTTPPTATTMDTTEVIHGLAAVQKIEASANNQGIYTALAFDNDEWYTIGCWVRGDTTFRFFRGTSGSSNVGPTFSSYAANPRWRFVTAAFQAGTSWTNVGIKATAAGNLWVTGFKIIKGRLSHNKMPPFGVNEPTA